MKAGRIDEVSLFACIPAGSLAPLPPELPQ